MQYKKVSAIFLMLVISFFLAKIFASPLPEINVPFTFTLVPPHRTLTARYFNASKWNFVSCYCSDDFNCPIEIRWKLKGTVVRVNMSGYMSIDTNNANHHGKLHFYNRSDRLDVSVRCQPEFEPPCKPYHEKTYQMVQYK